MPLSPFLAAFCTLKHHQSTLQLRIDRFRAELKTQEINPADEEWVCAVNMIPDANLGPIGSRLRMARESLRNIYKAAGVQLSTPTSA